MALKEREALARIRDAVTPDTRKDDEDGEKGVTASLPSHTIHVIWSKHVHIEISISGQLAC